MIPVGNAYHHAANARMGAQALQGMENDGTAEEREILLGLGGLHALALAAGRYQSPDSLSGGQAGLHAGNQACSSI